MLLGGNHTSLSDAAVRESWAQSAVEGHLALAYEFSVGARIGVDPVCDFLNVCAKDSPGGEARGLIFGIEEPLLNAFQGLLAAYARAIYIERAWTLEECTGTPLLDEPTRDLLWREAVSGMMLFMVGVLQYPSVEEAWLKLSFQEKNDFSQWIRIQLQEASWECGAGINASLDYLKSCMMRYLLFGVRRPSRDSVHFFLQGLPRIVSSYVKELLDRLEDLPENLGTSLLGIPKEFEALAAFEFEEHSAAALESFKQKSSQYLYTVLLPHRELYMYEWW